MVNKKVNNNSNVLNLKLELERMANRQYHKINILCVVYTMVSVVNEKLLKLEMSNVNWVLFLK